MTDYDDLVRRLRPQTGRATKLESEAADAIEVLREHVASLESAIMTREHDWARAERAEAENAALREALIDVLASLVAAHSLLEGGGKKAAASDKMFNQMLKDYSASIERGRAALLAGKEGK